MTNGIAKQSSLSLGLGLALVLVGACDDSPAPEADEASFRVLDTLVIDDFKTGPVQAEVDTVDQLEVSQAGAGILGGSRCLDLEATVNPYDRPLSVEVREGEDGYLALESGVGIHQALVLQYGYDEQCNATGLNADFSPYTHLRLEFAPLLDVYGALDQGLGGGIVVWSSSGAGSVPLSIDEQTRTRDVALADFDGDIDWADVQEIVVVMQSGGPVPGYDYILQSFAAVALEQ